MNHAILFLKGKIIPWNEPSSTYYLLPALGCHNHNHSFNNKLSPQSLQHFGDSFLFNLIMGPSSHNRKSLAPSSEASSSDDDDHRGSKQKNKNHNKTETPMRRRRNSSNNLLLVPDHPSSVSAMSADSSSSFSDLDPQVQKYLQSRARREKEHGHTVSLMIGGQYNHNHSSLLSSPVKSSSKSKRKQQQQQRDEEEEDSPPEAPGNSSSSFVSPAIQAKIRKAMHRMRQAKDSLERKQQQQQESDQSNPIQRSQSDLGVAGGGYDGEPPVVVVHQELIQEELRFKMKHHPTGTNHHRDTDSDSYDSDDYSESANPNDLSTGGGGSQRHLLRHRMQSVEMGPGIEVPFRGTDETKLAVHRDYFVPIQCGNCGQHIFCIQDAAFVLCPHPQCKAKTFLGWEENGGVGLGFTLEDLEQLQWTSRQNKEGAAMPKVKASLLPELD